MHSTYEVALQQEYDDSLTTGDNVDLVKSFFTEEIFDELFPNADSAYKYSDLIKAIAKFPQFCNNLGFFGSNGLLDVEETCKK